MTWAAILVLAAGAYALKATGVIALGRRSLPGRVDEALALLPAALLVSLSLVQTFSAGSRLVVDARAAGLAVAVALAWRNAPLPVVIVGAAAVTAALRAL